MMRLEESAVAERTLMPVADASGRFLEFLGEASYPCVGAKSALARGSIETHDFDALGDRDNDQRLLDALSRFVDLIEANSSDESI